MKYVFKDMGDYVTDQIDKELKKIPPNATEISLRYNKLHLLPITELIKIIDSFPDSVESLDLSANDLGKLSIEDWIQLLQAIGRKNIKSLDLGFNDLSLLNADGLARVFADIPEKVCKLLLEFNQLGKLKGPSLINAFSMLHKKITTLNLSSNDLIQLGTDLPGFLTKVSVMLDALHLNDNGLGLLKTPYLSFLIRSLSPKIAYLYLARNSLLKNRSVADLITIMEELQPGVVFLDLQGNGIDRLKPEELSWFYDSFAVHINGIIVDTAPVSPQSLRIETEIALLNKPSGAAALISTAGLLKSADDKINALKKLRDILDSRAREPQMPDDEFSKILQDWNKQHATALKEVRNKVIGYFQPEQITSTQKMLDKVFTKLGIKGYLDSLQPK